MPESEAIVYHDQSAVPIDIPDGWVRVSGVRDLDDDSLWFAIEDGDRIIFLDAQFVPADKQDRRYVTLMIYMDMPTHEVGAFLTVIDEHGINLFDLDETEEGQE